MATTLSGWPGIHSGDSRLKIYTIPGTKTKDLPMGRRVTLRRDVGHYLVAVAAEWHKRIDPLNKYTGGHIYRAARFSSSLSDHAAGTAIDLSWDKFPMAKRGTLTKSQLREIEKIKSEFPGIGWGGDWGGGPNGTGHTYDPMHWYLTENDPTFYVEKARQLGIDDDGYMLKVTKQPSKLNPFAAKPIDDRTKDAIVDKQVKSKDLRNRKSQLQKRLAALKLQLPKTKVKEEKQRITKLINDINLELRSLD